MGMTPARTRLLVATAIVMVLVVAVVSYSAALQRSSKPMSPSKVVAKRPSGTVAVVGVVVSSTASDGVTRPVIADESGPKTAVLELRYSGTQRVSFGRGVVVIARGRVESDGVFRVDEFVLKSPGS